MSFVIVPNSLRDEIYKRLDKELKEHPDAAQDRELIYSQILKCFDDYGVIPEFKLEKKC